MLNTLGCVVEENWFKSNNLRKEIILDAFVVMPNHIHGIIMIIGEPPVAAHSNGAHSRAEGASLAPLPQTAALYRPPRSLGSFVAGFKSAVTSQINRIRETASMPVWQRSFHDKIIWNEPMLNGIRTYIENNPANWVSDRENPTFDKR